MQCCFITTIFFRLRLNNFQITKSINLNIYILFKYKILDTPSITFCTLIFLKLFRRYSLAEVNELFSKILYYKKIYLAVSNFVIYSSISLFLYFSISLFIYVSIYLFIYFSISLFLYLSMYLFIYLSMYLFICLSIYRLSHLWIKDIVSHVYWNLYKSENRTTSCLKTCINVLNVCVHLFYSFMWV